MIFVKNNMIDVAMSSKVAGLSEVTTSSTDEVLLIKIFHLIFIAKDEIILLFNHFSFSVRNDFSKHDWSGYEAADKRKQGTNSRADQGETKSLHCV